MQGKKFISPGAWFSMNYPSDWNEFEDGEGSFLFYNPDVWTGNFRISAFKGKAGYGKDAIRQELKENDSASLVKVGTWECAYSKEMFQEEGTYYTSHLWITGVDDIAFECSFTVPKGGVVKEAEDVIATLEVRKEGQKYPAELIPVRLSEIYLINEGYEWVVSTVKQELKKDFRYNIKQRGGMLAKGRLLGIQFLTLFEENRYFDISAHAARLAEKLKDELIKMGVKFYIDSPTNQQFPILPDAVLAELKKKYSFAYQERMDETHSAVRFCTCWATKDENVEALLADIRAII